MPEYITKNEPVDKKPYIVYTGDKNIVYSGDPDADIPGGYTEYNVACYNNSPTQIDSFLYKTKVSSFIPDNSEDAIYFLEPTGEPVNTAFAGECLMAAENIKITSVSTGYDETDYVFPYGQLTLNDDTTRYAFVMPTHDVFVMRQ